MPHYLVANNSHCKIPDFGGGNGIRLSIVYDKDIQSCEDACRATAGCKIFALFSTNWPGRCDLYQKCDEF